MKKWKKISSELVYNSKYFKVRKDVVQLPNQERKEWTYWDSQDSAMVLGMTKDKKLVMIKQYRYLVGSEVIEFPSGHLNSGENIETAAKREFSEETGYKIIGKLIILGSFYETYGQLNRKIHLFFSDNIVETDRDHKIDDDVAEDIEVILVNFNKAIKLAIDNKIIAMGSALAILLLNQKQKSN